MAVYPLYSFPGHMCDLVVQIESMMVSSVMLDSDVDLS